MSFFSKTCDPCHVALCVRNSPALVLNLTEFTRLHCYVFFVCGCATSKWSDVLFWEMIRLKSHTSIPKSIRCKEYIDVSNCPTWILLRIHAKLKHRLDRFVRNYPHVRNLTPLPYLKRGMPWCQNTQGEPTILFGTFVVIAPLLSPIWLAKLENIVLNTLIYI